MADTPERISSIDAWRGIAAICVVFWHYGGLLPPNPQTVDYPLWPILWPIYARGYLGVEMFFTISGFIFTLLYANRIAAKTISAREFFVRRFSRLYPLHFATLIAVAVLQLIYFNQHSSYFGDLQNSPFYFATNLLMVNQWIPAKFSFNGPAWSLSVEVALYAIFFGIAVCSRLTTIWIIAVCVAAVIIKGGSLQSQAILSFFLGALVARSFDKDSIDGRRGLYWICLVWGAVILRQIIHPRLPAFDVFANVFLFPVIVYVSYACRRQLSFITDRLEWLGASSYSIYLVHFPLMIAIVLLRDAGILTISFVNPMAMAAYFTVLVLLSYLIFSSFEKPAMAAIRKSIGRDSMSTSRSMLEESTLT
jgi:peptidoglycan/LPS O-acetylase OafA/YrhL